MICFLSGQNIDSKELDCKIMDRLDLAALFRLSKSVQVFGLIIGPSRIAAQG
jgi:hypothetical protein